jgi:ATP-dependent RNA helicase DOB1
MIDEKMEPDVAKGMLYGDPDPLYSSYHVSYNMVLNMMRVEDADPEHILRASFYQYQREQKAPELERQAHELQHSAMSLHIPHEEQVAEYTLLLRQLERTQAELETLLFQPKYCLPFLQPGRVIILTVRSGSIGSLTTTSSASSSPTIKPLSWGQGVIVNCRKMDGKNTGNSGNTLSADVVSVLGKETEEETVEYVMDVLVEAVRVPNSLQLSSHLTGLAGASYLPHSLYESLRSASSSGLPSLPSEHLILQFTITTLSSITAIRLNLPKDLRKAQAVTNVARALQEVKRRFSTQPLPLLDPKEDMKITDDGGLYDVLLGRSIELQNRMKSSEFNRLDLATPAAAAAPGDGSKRTSKKAKVTEGSAAAAATGGGGDGAVALLSKETLLSLYETKQGLLLQSKHFHHLASDTKAILMKSELKNMKRLLKRLHFISRENEVLEVKGRFSCEINTSDEVLLTDMVFEGIFNPLSVEATVSLLSCFVYNEPVKTGGGAGGGGAAGAGAVGPSGPAGGAAAAASVTATSSFTKLRPEYQSLVKSLHNLAVKLYSYRSEYKLNTAAEEAFLSSFNFSLMEAISLWCSGGKFIDVCRMTDVYEGTIIRVIRRLEELLRQLITASMMIGNMELKAKFEEGADRIRRGIIFTSSLYL